VLYAEANRNCSAVINGGLIESAPGHPYSAEGVFFQFVYVVSDLSPRFVLHS
jgi:hypothetical protein